MSCWHNHFSSPFATTFHLALRMTLPNSGMRVERVLLFLTLNFGFGLAFGKKGGLVLTIKLKFFNLLYFLVNVEAIWFSMCCRNDGMEDRYSVLITLVNQLTSDGFYCSFNGKRFRPSEVPGFLHLHVQLR